MSINTYPLDAASGAPVYSGRKLRQTTVSPFLTLGTTARPLGARSGIRPGTPDSVFSISGTTWSVGLHSGVIDAAAAGEAGAYVYANDAPITGTTAAAHASLTRWDLIYAQLSDPAESAGTGAPRVDIVYLANPSTPATPALPALPARSIALARVVVPASGGGSPSIVAISPFTGSAGAAVQFRTKAELDLWTTAGKNTRATVTDDPVSALNGDYQFIGSVWVAMARLIGASGTVTPNPPIGAGLMEIVGIVSATTGGTGAVNIALPGGGFPTGLASLVFTPTNNSTVSDLRLVTGSTNKSTFQVFAPGNANKPIELAIIGKGW